MWRDEDEAAFRQSRRNQTGEERPSHAQAWRVRPGALVSLAAAALAMVALWHATQNDRANAAAAAAAAAATPPADRAGAAADEPRAGGAGAASAAGAAAGEHVRAESSVAAGRYIVKLGGCNDCHTPGFAPSGGRVPESEWLVGDTVGFRGPWGTTYPQNLRLFVQDLREDDFVQIVRARNDRPPMPWPSLHAMSDADLRSVYRYVRSLGVKGQPAPAWVPPGEEPKTPFIVFVPQNLPPAATPGAPAGGARQPSAKAE